MDTPLPSAAAGGVALVAAMETVDRVLRSFTEDFGRAVAVVRAEVTRERDAALALVDSSRVEVEQARLALVAERERFDTDRLRERAELDRAWQELYAARDRDVMLHAAAEAALREAHAATAAADALDRRAAATLAAVAGASAVAPPPRAPLHAAAVAATVGATGWGVNGMPQTWGDMRMSSTGGDMPADVVLAVVGGLKGASQPVSTCEAWHPSVGWRPLPGLSCSRAYCASAGAGPRGRAGDTVVYAIGGSDGGAPTDTVEALHLGPHLSAMQAPDGSDGVALPGWRRIAHMTKPRVWHSACALGEAVYVAGGFDGRTYVADCEALDVHVDAPRGMWTPIKGLPKPCSMLALAPLKGLLYATGGFLPPSYSADVSCYDPGADTWWPVAPLRDARREHAAAGLEQHGMLLVCGGYDGARYVPSCEGFDPRTQGWHPLAPLRRPRQLLGCAAAGGCVYAIGGFDGAAPGHWVDVYDPRKDAWREHAPLAGGPRMAHGVVAVPWL